MNFNHNINDIIDICSYQINTKNDCVILIITKNASIYMYNTVPNETDYIESLELMQNITFNEQLIKYNGTNIFDIKNVYDVIK